MIGKVNASTVEVVRNYLSSAAGEMQRTLIRTAYNTIVYEILDFGISLYDRDLQLVADSPGMATFLGANDYAIRKGVEYVGRENLDPGDVLILNYPYWSGSHTLDVCLFAPIPDACPEGERCDADEGCVPESVLPDAGPGELDAGSTCEDGASCDDGLFCNGADHCSGGSCAGHAGNPCAGACDEESDSCPECVDDSDCPPPELGGWSACGGFTDPCDDRGTRSRDVTRYRCEGGACRASTSAESGRCARDTDGDGCGADEVTGWSACGDFPTECATTGTQSRTRTVYTCSGGSCGSDEMMESQPCTRDPTGIGCEDGDPCTLNDRCTSSGMCLGMPECRPIACMGACPIPVCTGSCLEYCDCL